MRPAIDFAREHGFTIEITKGNHLLFKGHGGRIYAPGTPSDHRAALATISRMKSALKAA